MENPEKEDYIEKVPEDSNSGSTDDSPDPGPGSSLKNLLKSIAYLSIPFVLLALTVYMSGVKSSVIVEEKQAAIKDAAHQSREKENTAPADAADLKAQPEDEATITGTGNLKALLEQHNKAVWQGVRANKFRASTWFSDYKAMLKTVHLYDEIHPFIYSIRGRAVNDGRLVSTWSSKKKKERIAELRKRNPRVIILPSIFRWENAREKINTAIGYRGRPDIRKKHINIIMNEVLTYGYDGIDIDYEGMPCSKKKDFEIFIKELSERLHAENKLLAVSVHPKTPLSSNRKPYYKNCGISGRVKVDYKENWRGPQAHDYEFLAEHADRVKIMAYELHPRKYRNPGPGPQAPAAWLEKIIKYATTKVPPEKLYMAIPTYGYDWALNCRSRIKTIYYSDALRLKARAGTKRIRPTKFDSIIKSHENSANWDNLLAFQKYHKNKSYEDPSLWYNENGCDRVAFYMDAAAFKAKMKLLRRYNLAGFSFWQLISDNDPGINRYLAELATAKDQPVKKQNTVSTGGTVNEKDKKTPAEMPPVQKRKGSLIIEENGISKIAPDTDS